MFFDYNDVDHPYWAEIDNSHDVEFFDYTGAEAQEFKEEALAVLEGTIIDLDQLAESQYSCFMQMFNHRNELGEIECNEDAYGMGMMQREAIIAIIQEACQKIKALDLSNENQLETLGKGFDEKYLNSLKKEYFKQKAKQADEEIF